MNAPQGWVRVEKELREKKPILLYKNIWQLKLHAYKKGKRGGTCYVPPSPLATHTYAKRNEPNFPHKMLFMEW